MIKQIPVRKLSLQHPFSDIEKDRGVFCRRPVVARKQPKQSRGRKGNTGATDCEC